MSDQSLISPERRAQHLYEEAQQYLEQGTFALARSLHEQALALREQHLGADHPDTARSLNGVASACIEQGDFQAAQACIERALVIQRQAFGSEHVDIARSLNDLGITYLVLDQVAQGHQLLQQAYTMRARLLGSEHTDTIESMNNLGIVLYRVGEHSQVIQLHEQALAICERVFGEQHRKTIESLNYLAAKLARNRATYARARTLYERALTSSEQVLGDIHPLVGQLLSNLGAVLADLGDEAAAQGTLERSLALHEQTLGPEHTNTAYVIMNLADLYTAQDNQAAAHPLYERALIIWEQSYGAHHANTLRALEKLVLCLGNLLSLEQAASDSQAAMDAGMLYQSTAGVPTKLPGIGYEATQLYICLTALQAAAGTLRPEDRHLVGASVNAPQAAANLHRIVERLKMKHTHSVLSPTEEAVLQQASQLEQQADVYFDIGDFESAAALFAEALALHEQVHGPYHLDYIPLLRKQVGVARVQGRYTAVLPLIERIAETHAQILGEGHIATTQALMEYMTLYIEEYGLGAARHIQERIHRGMEETLGADDSHVRLIRRVVDLTEGDEEDDDIPDEPRSAHWERAEAALRENPPALLADIYEVDWENLEHAYGSASDVPHLLMLLLSDDEVIREDVYESLYSNIWHQGTVYEATSYAVPFLLRLLEHPDTPDKASIMYLLSSLAEGNSYLAAHHCEGDELFDWRTLLEEDGKDFDEELNKELSWVEAANRAVGKGVDLYFQLLDEDNDELRNCAFELLGVVRGRSDEIVPRLLALLHTTDDTARREQIVQVLNRQMDSSEGTQQFFSDLLQQHESETLAYTAAVALTERAREQTPEAAVEIIVSATQVLGMLHPYDRHLDAAIRAAHYEAERRYSSGTGYGLDGAIAALLHLGSVRVLPILLRILPWVADAAATQRIAGILLDLVFNAGDIQQKGFTLEWDEGQAKNCIYNYCKPTPQAPRSVSSLTTEQRAALGALVAHEPLWQFKSSLLELYGLPTEREQVRRLLA